MAAIISGDTLGLSLSSLHLLGERGRIGEAALGRSGERAYVNIATGNLVLQDQDNLLIQRGAEMTALRTYNSQGRCTDDNGDNWTMGLYRQQIIASSALQQTGSRLTRLERDGGQAHYHWDAAECAYLSSAGACHRIRLDGAHYIWSDGARQETYARASGRLSSSTDAHGHRLDYRFDAHGNLNQVAGVDGEATCYDYDGNDLTQIRSITADGGVQTRTRYRYDDRHRLTTVTIALSPEDDSIADGRHYTTRYRYDGDSTRIAGITHPDGSQISFVYQETDGTWRIASITDGLGQATHYTYDANATTVTDALGQATVYTCDAAGRLTGVATPAAGAVTRYRYDARGNVIQIIDAEGRAIDMRYDSNGNQLRQEDAAGNIIMRRFDAYNQLIAETHVNEHTHEAARTTRHIYAADKRHLLRFTITAQGRVTEYRYDDHGQRTSVLQHNAAYALATAAAPDETAMAAWAASHDPQSARRTDMAYDARGQLRTLTSYAALDTDGSGSAAGAVSVHYVYDQAGLLLETIDGNGGVTTYTYDGMGRQLTRHTQGRLTVTRYDDAGNSISTTAPPHTCTTPPAGC